MIIFLTLMPAFHCLKLNAQQTSATLVGTVTDSSNAVVPGATIRATNLATGVWREALTDDNGAYSFPFLTAGEYSVSASLPGFKIQRRDRVILGVQQTGRVDFQLTVGEVTQTISVEGTAILLQTETSMVGTVIDSGALRESLLKRALTRPLVSKNVQSPGPPPAGWALRFIRHPGWPAPCGGPMAITRKNGFQVL
jgi:hypothetical protein